MPMDKSWIQKPRDTHEYQDGVVQFLDFAFSHSRFVDMIQCPCVKCRNVILKDRDEVHGDLLWYGFMKTYTLWTRHGEDYEYEYVSDEFDESDDMQGLLQDAFGIPNFNHGEDNVPNERDSEEPNRDANKFYDMLKDAEVELYPGCTKFSKLSFLVRLLHLKCLNGWSNKSFDMLLELIKEALPSDEKLPKNYYESKKILRELGLHYTKIDSCPNDCMLYWKEHDKRNECIICGESRWKLVKCQVTEDDVTLSTEDKKIPAKILRYFPLKPRLKRLFMSFKTAEHMRWHAEGRPKDGVLRHPADSKAWKALDDKYPTFGSELRNVRLGLASDGFTPFSYMNTPHSTWPVVLVLYNLPPWMCMKQTSFILSMLIPGPKAPVNDIDVFLQPLIEELRELWIDGVETYDAYSKQNFQMHAAVLWTINDFPAYANLSGWSTKGKLACPCCHKNTCSVRLEKGKKECYLGHRRFLPFDHKFRHNKRSFNGQKELRPAPKPLTGEDVFNQLRNHEQIIFGKAEMDIIGRKRKKDDCKLPKNWKKKSIFFKLPYWKDLLLRHSLDVMHIEKNVCDSVIGTLLNIDGSTKDNLKARLDMQLMGIREELHPKLVGGKVLLPPACYTMSLIEKRKFCKFLKEVKVPDSYSSNFSRCIQVKQCKISGLKSHDCHILMQQFIPLAIRGILPKNVCLVLIELSTFFRQLCSKVLRLGELEQLESQIILTLCKLEMIFPPAFFDIMMHLPIHLASEAKVAGPVQYRWMYPIERYLHRLKSYVRNKNHPEGSIAEGYLCEESLTFCSRYLHGIETRFNRPPRNNDSVDAQSNEKLSIFIEIGRAIGKASSQLFKIDEWEQAHLYVLNNCDEVTPFVSQHKQIIKDTHNHMSIRDVERKHVKEFAEWFKHHVSLMQLDGGNINEQLEMLALGPAHTVMTYKGYIVNGFRFHTKERERQRKTQNSGVFVTAETHSFASAKDINPMIGNVGYYGILNNVIELKYPGGNRVVLFKCHWWDVMNRGGFKQDEYGFNCVNIRRALTTNEPFILAKQAQQIFYMQDTTNDDWRVVINSQPRDIYNMSLEEEPQEEPFQENELELHQIAIDTNDDVVSWNRNDIEGILVGDNDEGNQVFIEGADHI